MKVLVTGASGFVGGAVTQALIERGYSVRALVRPGSETTALTKMGVELAIGDILDEASLASAMNDVEALFHVAAVYSYSARDSRNTYRVNVDGVRSVLEAAGHAGVNRAVYTSTVATLKWPGQERLADEAAVATLADLPGHYKRSKFMGEQVALSFNSPGFEVVVVNPTAPFGPGDARPTPTGRIVLEFLRRSMPGYIDTGMNVCDVDDIGHGHVSAFEKGRGGQRYILGGASNLSLSAIYGALARITGLKRTPVRIPYALALTAGVLDWLVEDLILRREPYIPIEGVRVARHPMYVECAKAVRELGLRQRPAEEALERAVRWYVDQGFVQV